MILSPLTDISSKLQFQTPHVLHGNLETKDKRALQNKKYEQHSIHHLFHVI